MRVLVTGATGFVGRRLVRALGAAGHSPVGAARVPTRAAREAPGLPWVRLDVEDPSSLAPALSGCDAAYYLVHGMGSGPDYPAREARGAAWFADAARAAGVRRVIYLGGVAPSGPASRHLRSRLRTGEILRDRADALEVRAGMIVGEGSASWTMVRDLAARLPAMLLPAWTRLRAAPVAIDDVLAALVGALEMPLGGARVFDAPGAETLTHEDTIRRVASLLGRRPAMWPVPMLTPRLSSHWIALVTGVDRGLARELVLGLQADLVPTEASIWAPLGHVPMSFDAAARRALGLSHPDDAVWPSARAGGAS